MPSDGLLVEVQVLLQAEPTKLRQIYRHTGDGIDDEVVEVYDKEAGAYVMRSNPACRGGVG